MMLLISEARLRKFAEDGFDAGWAMKDVSGNPENDRFDFCQQLVDDFKAARTHTWTEKELKEAARGFTLEEYETTRLHRESEPETVPHKPTSSSRL